MEQINLNKNWLFRFGENIGDEQAGSYPDYDHIALPHSFGIPYYGTADFYVGYGCYQKDLIIEISLEGKRFILEFGAVFQAAEIYVNGSFAGRHEGGYTAFTCDITDHAAAGKNNLFIRVNNLWKATLAPRAGEHTFNGGIYRDVKLLVYPEAHIDWYGTFVYTKRLDENQAEIVVETDTVNCIGQTLHSVIQDAEGCVVAEVRTTIEDNHTVQTMLIERPVLWDIVHPHLYQLHSSCGEDSLVTEFGVRSIRWDKDEGFFLNGKRVLLEGANVHQDRGGWGDAATHAGIRRDIRMMKDCGFNFIRGSHYPHHTQFARECDRQGMLFWSEGVFWGIGGFGGDGYWNASAMPLHAEEIAPFEASLKQTLAEMIRTNRNSPSIIAWSMGNEMFFSEKSVLPAARELAARLVVHSHALDSSRPAALGGVQREGFDAIGDIAGYNGDGAVLYKNPSLPSMVSEYGSIPSYRPGKYDLYETKGSDEYYPWRAGRAIWCGFHHGSLADIGDLGIVDLYRLPLNAWYCHREKLTGAKPPVPARKGKAQYIKLRADKTEIQTDGTDDCMLIAELFDEKNNRVNTDLEITLEVVSGPGLLPTGQAMRFNRQLKNCFDGSCAIEMRAYYAGDIVIQASADGMIGDEITISALGEPEDVIQINYPLAPHQTKQAEKQRVNLINNRPVTVSSERVPGSCLCITSESEHRYWSPAKGDPAPWLILDMENCYENVEIHIAKKNFKAIHYRVYSSLDKENWVLHGEVAQKARYIKIEVPNEMKLRSIQIFEK